MGIIILWLSAMAGLGMLVITDIFLIKIYRCPPLSLLLAKCYNSKYFKWLTWNVWGNDDWYYEMIILHTKGRNK